ncbi:MAG: sigma-70 family RNA polymerase sigma factor [Clostridia bacterium]|nr:sigma-70 family RNA polymerase sigma factor [Clostridia bacterium]
MTDEELVVSARVDASAMDGLLKKYTPMVKGICARFFLHGGESEDLEQEGMVGLYSAINTFGAGGANFSSYAYSCIRNAVLDAVKKSTGAKHSALNDFVPIVEIKSEPYSVNPEDEVIKSEQRSEFLLKISKILSSMEFKAMVMRLDGVSVADIAVALGKKPRSVTNALNRAKTKLEDMYREGN